MSLKDRLLMRQPNAATCFEVLKGWGRPPSPSREARARYQAARRRFKLYPTTTNRHALWSIAARSAARWIQEEYEKTLDK